MLEDNTVHRSGTDAMQTYLDSFLFNLAIDDREAREARFAIYRMLESSVGVSASNSIERSELHWHLYPSHDMSFDSEELRQVHDGMRFLKDVGCDFNDFNAAYDPIGSALMCAVLLYDELLVHLLLRYGADVNIRYSKGRNVLHYLVLYDDYCDSFFNIAKQLIEAGCDISATNAYGVTPTCAALHATDHTVFARWKRALADCGINVFDVIRAEITQDLEGRAQSSATDLGPIKETLRHRIRPIARGQDTTS